MPSLTMEELNFLQQTKAFDLLFHTSESIVSTILSNMNGGHPAGTWMKEGDEHHIKKAETHTLQFNLAGYRLTDEDLEHALCRLAMALWCRKNGVLGDFGPDGKEYNG